VSGGARKRRDVRGDERPWGETTCGYGKHEPDCIAPATRHFVWLDNMYTTMACDEHAEWLRDHSAHEWDEHAFGGDCGMPGALWHFAYEDEDEGYCVFPAPDDASLLTEEPEPALAAALAADRDAAGGE
jgi:hypothetical protein